MTTRTALKATILDDMKRTSVADGTRVINEISTAIKFYQPRRFFFNESRSVTFNTVAATDSYSFGAAAAITTEFYTIDGVFVVEGGREHPVLPRNYTDIETLIDTTPTQGRPTSYAFINRALRFYPVPDAVYSVRLVGHVKLAEPASDGEASNAWMTEAYELIRCRAKMMLALHVFKDTDLAARMLPAMKEAEQSLRTATTSKVGTGVLMPTSF